MKKKIIISVIMFIAILLIANYSKAAGTMKVSKSTSSVQEGGSFTTTVSGVNGRVKISGKNCSVSPAGTQFIEGSLTITASNCSGSNATVTISPVDVSTTAADPQEVTAAGSATVSVTKKQSAPAPAPVQTPTPASTSSNNNNNSKKTTNNNNNNKKTETKKQETKTEEKTEETPTEEAKTFDESTYNLTDMKFMAVNEKGEETEVKADKDFDPNTFDYTVNVDSETLRMNITYDSHGYEVTPEAPGDLQEGENTFKYTLKFDGQPDKTYTIKVIKATPEVNNEENTVEEETTTDEQKEPAKVSLKVWQLVLIIIASIAVGCCIMFAIYKILKNKKKI